MNKKVAIITFARFPSEMAYGIHLVQIAKSFIENNCDVNVYYPKTYNSKTIDEHPKDYYKINNDINFKEIGNVDITSYKIYNVAPKILQKFIFSINTFIWAYKVRKYLENEDFLWSTNPNLILVLKKLFKKSFYEKHGESKYVQKFSISKLKKDKNVQMIGITKKSYEELSDPINPPIYLPLGVDRKLFFPRDLKTSHLTIGYVGMLETHSVDKGVFNACKEIIKINNDFETKTIIVGGPEKKLEEIEKFIEIKNKNSYFEINKFVPHEEVPEIISRFNIGIVPYPNNKHMNLYASPMKIFELASCGIPILASNIDSHLELESLNLGIVYFDHDNFNDFRNKLINLIKDEKLRFELTKKSLNNIDKFSFVNRTKEMLISACGSTG
ncbi:MAG: glycosyltransferase [Flavobacteriaceae bacterium TMED238]|nr:MAG: glycosyltransferase [Flavobacteriaceae bacterium TMED238]